jgi:hypothetical protein
LVQLGDAGGIETSGYISFSNGQAGTTGFKQFAGNAAATLSGIMVISLKNAADFTWAAFGKTTTNAGDLGMAGHKALSAELTQVTVTRNGSDTFDAGSVNISYF